MGDPRPAIPRPIARDVYVEAGHRCAIPTCRATSGLEIHHIVAYSDVKEHKFDNLILLCAICHSRVTRGEIDTRAVKAYKSNLSLLSGRYGDLERRALEQFVRNPELEELVIDRGHKLLLDYLVRDGILEESGPARGAFLFGDMNEDEFHGPCKWVLTAEGQQLVEHLRNAEAID